MKKNIIAVAVAAAIAAPAAMAQVSIYGRIDASFASIDTAGATAATAQTQSNGDYRGSSALGFRGSEDLGGGLKASFVLEGDLDVNNGDGDGTGGGLLFDRQSWIGLSGGFGSVKVGRTADAVDSVKGKHGMGFNLFDSSDATVIAGGKIPQIVRYDSPSFMGLDFNLSNTVDNNAANLAAGSTTNTGQTTSMGLNYKLKDLTLGYANAKESTTGADDETTIVSVEYKLPFASVAFRHQKDESTATTKYNALGVAVPFGGGISAVGHYQKSSGAGENANFKSMGVAVEKALSKRTAIYAGYKTKDLTGTGSDVDTTVFGIDHAF